MTGEETKKIIESYIQAYNSFDIGGMIDLLHEDVIFKNYLNGVMNTETKGKQQFRDLAQQSSQIFSSRRQTITDYRAAEDTVELRIDYEGIISIDLPNGVKAGEKLQLQGKSVFRMCEGKISSIEDYS